MRRAGFAAFAALAPAATAAEAAKTWRGLVVAPERRRAPYDKRAQYPYPQSVEARIVEGMGGRMYAPYTGRYFASRRETDIEHMVVTSEAHDSGRCAMGSGTRRRFARDLSNLTLASPRVNRREKGGKDAGEWLPRFNACWFAGRAVAVKRKYALTVDQREARALEGVLAGCASTAMVMAQGGARRPSRRAKRRHPRARTRPSVARAREPASIHERLGKQHRMTMRRVRADFSGGPVSSHGGRCCCARWQLPGEGRTFIRWRIQNGFSQSPMKSRR